MEIPRTYPIPPAPMAPTPQAQLGCDFHEPYFGASYPDACCIDGFLWDLDSCEVPGGPLFSGGDVPCPQCNHDEWLERVVKDEMAEKGYNAFRRDEPRRYAHKRIRHEQPGDAAKCERWWNDGFDQAEQDHSDMEQRGHHE